MMKEIGLALFAAAFCLFSLPSARAEANWLTDFTQAQAEAKAGHKLLLLDFTGSDWCGWCKRLQAEVFSKPEFEDYAKENLVLLKVDFPRAQPLSSELRKQNYELAAKFSVQGFPTIVVLNGDGKPVGLLGYVPGGPEAFLGELKKVPRG
ncbi:MAG: thioredoxin family protein [Chthoniobacterales bacterium]